MLGGIIREKDLSLGGKVIEQIHMSLNSKGYLFFAENLNSSPIHKALRKRNYYGKGSSPWRYLTIDQIKKIIQSKFESHDFITKGFLGCFGRNEMQRNMLGKIDSLMFDNIVPQKYKYIIIGICQKK